MQLTVIGLNHQTAPLGIREKLAFSAEALPEAFSLDNKVKIVDNLVIFGLINWLEHQPAHKE